MRQSLLFAVLVLACAGLAQAQVATCSISTPLGPTPRATATGHTEPVAAGPNGIPPAPGGGTVRVTCTSIGGGTIGQASSMAISFGTSITNTISHPSPSAGIRVTNGVGAFVTGVNTSVSSVNYLQGSVVIATTAGITFSAGSTNSFDLSGVLVSVNGKTGSISATLTNLGSGYTLGSPADVQVISAISGALSDPTVPSGPAVLTGDGSVVKGDFTIRIQEAYVDAFKDATQFNGGLSGGVFPNSPSSDVQVMVAFSNIPAGLDISPCSVTITDVSGIPSSGTPTLNFTNVTAASPVLTVNFNNTVSQSAIDVLRLTCSNVNKGSATLPLPGVDITAQVTLAPVGSALNASNQPLTGLTTGQVPRYQMFLQPALGTTVVSLLTPTITSITPSFGLPGNIVNATITGTKLAGASTVTFSGVGVSGTVEMDGTDTSLPVTIDISGGAPLGLRTVTVMTGGGTSLPFFGFNVGDGPIKKAVRQITSQ